MTNDFHEILPDKKLSPIMFYELVMPKRPLPHVLACGKRFGVFEIFRFFEKSMKIDENLGIFTISDILANSLRSDIEITLQNHDE